MRHLRPRHLFDRSNLDPEHMAIKKQQGTERLILCRCADAPRGRKPRQEYPDLWRSHRRGMLLAVKDDESPDLLNVGVLGPPAVVPRSDSIPHTIEELRLRSRLGERNDRWCWETISHARAVSEQRASTVPIQLPLKGDDIVRVGCLTWKLLR
jgi:hypothetical protein